jgi:ABC-2 type transport system ATP-binding protein
MNLAVKVQNLTKRYGAITAVDNISFDIEKGTIFGLLGPNGAGKTTTVEMIEGLRKPDGGMIEIEGINALTDIDKVKEIIGVQLQSTTLYEKIRVKEALDLFGGYYKESIPSEQILKEVSLEDRKDSYVGTLSGGLKQRVAMGIALVNDPEVLFLDEPTTGLDPQARRNVWGIIENLRGKGKTIFLTTHYMEEAEQLCQRVGIMDYGKIIAMDSPKNLIASSGIASSIEFHSLPAEIELVQSELNGIGEFIRNGETGFILHTDEASKKLVEIAQVAAEKNLDLKNLNVREASLEDVFLHLTGRKLRD